MPCGKCWQKLSTNHESCTLCRQACSDPNVVARNTIAYRKRMTGQAYFKGWMVGTHVLVDDEHEPDSMNYTGVLMFPTWATTNDQGIPDDPSPVSYHIVSDRDSHNVLPATHFYEVNAENVFVIYGIYDSAWPEDAISQGAQVIASSCHCIEPISNWHGKIIACAVTTNEEVAMYKVEFTQKRKSTLTPLVDWCNACDVKDASVSPAAKYPVGSFVQLTIGITIKRAKVIQHNWRSGKYRIEVYNDKSGKTDRLWFEESYLAIVSPRKYQVWKEGSVKIGARCMAMVEGRELNVLVCVRVCVQYSQCIYLFSEHEHEQVLRYEPNDPLEPGPGRNLCMQPDGNEVWVRDNDCRSAPAPSLAPASAAPTAPSKIKAAAAAAPAAAPPPVPPLPGKQNKGSKDKRTSAPAPSAGNGAAGSKTNPPQPPPPAAPPAAAAAKKANPQSSKDSGDNLVWTFETLCVLLDTIAAVNPWTVSKQAGVKKVTGQCKWDAIAKQMKDSTAGRPASERIDTTGDNIRTKFVRLSRALAPQDKALDKTSGATGASVPAGQGTLIEKVVACLEIKAAAEAIKLNIRSLEDAHKSHRDGVITQATIDAACGSEPHKRQLYLALDRKDKARRAQIATLQAGGHALPESTAEECRNIALYEQMSLENPGWKTDLQTLGARGSKGGGRVADNIKDVCALAATFLKDSARTGDGDTDRAIVEFLKVATENLAHQNQSNVRQSTSPVAAGGGGAAFSPPAVRPRQSKEERLRDVKRCLDQDLITQQHYDQAVGAILLDN